MRKAWQLHFDPRKDVGKGDLKENLEVRESSGSKVKKMKSLSNQKATGVALVRDRKLSTSFLIFCSGPGTKQKPITQRMSMTFFHVSITFFFVLYWTNHLNASKYSSSSL